MTRRRCIVAGVVTFWAAALLALVVTSGCSRGELPARVAYNEALALLESGDWQGAAAGFLEARQSAGQDPELRYRAAFNLGLALSRQADALTGSEPEQAMQKLRESAAWFRDAQSLAPGDDDARTNLELVLRRIQILADQLNKGANRLEARLDEIIDGDSGQRALRDRVRQLMTQVAASGSQSEPVHFQAEFDALATTQRVLLAEAGAISDLAGEELGLLQSKARQDETQLTDEERVRMVQLESLEAHLQKARENLADTRRLLRRLQGDRAHRRADLGLHDLKRAREQLHDPVAVLKAVAEDQTMLLMHTGALAQLRAGAVRLSDDASAPAEAPPWLTTEHLAERQDGARQRTAEVLARFESAASHGEDAQASPKQARVLASARAAIPFLQRATAAMDSSREALIAARLAEAAERQGEALEALYAAIERFGGIRELIELVHREHTAAAALLALPEQHDPHLPEHLARLDDAGRAEHIAGSLARNLDRLGRLEGLFQDEVAEAAAQAQAQGGAGAPAADGDPLEQTRELYAHADELRRRAVDALTRLGPAVAARGPAARVAEARAEARRIAAEATGHIDELRRLFYSIIEHLKELLRNQTDTHDRTAAAVDPIELASKLGPLVPLQQRHAATGEPLGAALAEQADAAAAGDDPSAAQRAQALSEAAGEVRDATAQMTGAARMLDEALAAAATMSPELGPALEAQRAAMEHLENAIRLLEPPQQDPQQDQDQDQQQQDQQQQDQQQQEQDMSKQQAERRLQEIRDREAERMREKQKRQQHKPEPVEKDW